MKRWCVLDVETTGLLKPSAGALETQPRIIELALVELTCWKAGDLFEQTDEKSWLINPGIPLTEEITKITGLTDADLKSAPPFERVLPEIVEAVLGAIGLAAHNLPFDHGMLVAELRRCGREHAFPYPPEQFCSVAAYHHLKGRNLKLTELYEHVMGKSLAQTHRALDDARALTELLLRDEALR